MRLLLHTHTDDSKLSHYYQSAFKQAVELFIVTAYLTDWDTTLKLSTDCRSFRIIIGKDYGITRKSACEAVMRWLPPKRKGQFMVADLINGFHPKAIFWKKSDGKCFTVVGSSNLTRAAFETNYEANVFMEISNTEYAAAKKWVRSIEKQAVVVSEDWLRRYKEAASAGGGSRRKPDEGRAVVALELPKPRGMEEHIAYRRNQLPKYKKKREGLISLFRSCADGRISSAQFYKKLSDYWSNDIGNRLQGKGWEILGKNSNFQILSKSYVRILDATDEDRDDVVAEEIDALKEQSVPTRQAFLSEMLCLEFPGEYPVLNKPVLYYLKAIKFKAPQGASEGVRYIDLALKLRSSLLQDPNYPAKNLAEIDTVIWLKFGKK